MSLFSDLCADMSARVPPALGTAGFSSADIPFRRDRDQYLFRRPSDAGDHVIAILFERRRPPRFSVQLYVDRRAGGKRDDRRTMPVATLSSRWRLWPLPVASFDAARPSRHRRPGGPAAAVDAFLALLPVADAWLATGRPSRYLIVAEAPNIPPGTFCL